MTIPEATYTSRVKPQYSTVYFDGIIGWTKKLSVRQEQDPLNGDECHIFDNDGVIRYNPQKRTIELSDRVDGVVRYEIRQKIGFEKSGGKRETEVQSSPPRKRTRNKALQMLRLTGVAAN